MRYKKSEKKKNAKAQNGQRHRSRRRKNYTLFYIMLALFIAGAGIYLSLTMFFNVEKITVEGDSRYGSEEIIATTGIEIGQNLFEIDAKKAGDKLLATYGYLEEAEVQKKFPTRIVIKLTAAEPFAALEEADGYSLISAKGKVLERKLQQPTAGLLAVRGISTVTGSEQDAHRLELLREIMADIEERDLKECNFLDLSDTLDIVMICQDRLRVELGNELEMAYKFEFIDEVITNKIESTGFMLVDASNPGEIMTRTMTVSPWDTITSQSPQVVPDDEEE